MLSWPQLKMTLRGKEEEKVEPFLSVLNLLVIDSISQSNRLSL